jgi:aryl-alcohol dehydrogenase-like predicted oxidoreductase
VVEACNDALKRLQVDYLDLYFCHRPDKNTPIEETVWTMHQLILQGKILYWGTSEWSAQEIMEAHMVAKQHHLIGPVMEQPQYNMFHRAKVEVEFEQIYKTVGLGTTIWSPLGQRHPQRQAHARRRQEQPPAHGRARLVARTRADHRAAQESGAVEGIARSSTSPCPCSPWPGA